MQAVIMAGGKGTRLSSVTKNEIPKPMVSFCGKPLIERIVEQLADNGIKDIVICVGYLGNQIIDYFSGYSANDVSLRFVSEDTPLGTAGALFLAKEYIHEDFVLVYADLMFDINISRMYKFHCEKKAVATLFVHPNSHPYDSDLVCCDENGRVIRFDYKDNVRNYDYDNIVNAGLVIMSPDILKCFTEPKKIALEKGLISKLLEDGEHIYAYQSPEYIKDVGTPDRLSSAEDEFRSGRIQASNLKNKQKAVFIDRDGTINKYDGLVIAPEQIELTETAATALELLNKSEYLAIVVTNQPVVARGDCTFETLFAIHKRMYTLLGNKGAYVDDLVFCPHHTDKGFSGEVLELKIDCDCRKPKPGMILEMAQRYNIDLSQSWMVGDTYRDVMTGKNAGVKTILVKSDADREWARFDVAADVECMDILDAVRYII